MGVCADTAHPGPGQARRRADAMGTALGSLLMLQLLLAFICHHVRAASEATTKRLHDDLFNNYDRNVRPVLDSSALTHVTFQMDVHEVDLLVYNMLRVETWTYWEWKDALLHWEPSRYEGIKEVAVKAASIWTPELVHISRGQLGNALRSPMSEGGQCRVTSSGDVSCLVEANYAAHCGMDLTNWPYDSQACSLSFVNWLDFDDEVSIALKNGTGYSLKYLKMSPEWQLVSVSSEQIPRQTNDDRRGYRKIDFYFNFRRHSDGYAATAVSPAIVLCLSTLATLLLPAWDSQRFCVGLCVLGAHYFALTDLYHDFSYNISVPYIILLYRDSLLMVAFGLLQAIVMRALIASSIRAPSFVVGLQDRIHTWPWGLSLMAQPREESASRKECESAVVWRQVSSLLDRVLFCLFAVIVITALLR